jgi:hypothetical protein
MRYFIYHAIGVKYHINRYLTYSNNKIIVRLCYKWSTITNNWNYYLHLFEEDGSRKLEVGRQKSEDRSRKLEVGRPKSEDRSRLAVTISFRLHTLLILTVLYGRENWPHFSSRR